MGSLDANFPVETRQPVVTLNAKLFGGNTSSPKKHKLPYHTHMPTTFAPDNSQKKSGSSIEPINIEIVQKYSKAGQYYRKASQPLTAHSPIKHRAHTSHGVNASNTLQTRR